MKKNALRHEKAFPTRYRIYPDDTRVIEKYTENIFEESEPSGPKL